MSEDWTDKPGRYVMSGQGLTPEVVAEATEHRAARGRTVDEDWAIQRHAATELENDSLYEDLHKSLADEAEDYWTNYNPSGIVTFSTGMIREAEKGRPRFDLLVPLGVPYEEQMLTRFAALLSRGADKYAERNWEKARTQEELERAKQSAFRHFMQWMCDEDNEDHAASAMFNILAAETIRYKMSEGE